MKIIFLNAWHGNLQTPLIDFLKSHRNTSDIFCFQEANGNMSAICQNALPDYQQITGYKFVNEYDEFPSLICIRMNTQMVSSGNILQDIEQTGLGIYAQVKNKDVPATILNFHGISRPGDKLDTEKRLEQSQEIIKFMKQQTGVKIIGGDFNLLPETKSVQLFEQSGYKNLIKDFNIPTTRNRLVWEKFPNNKQLHSNYVFVEQGTKVKSFTVENIEISDHLPMILEI